MEAVKWNDRFKLGVEVIDRAHQNLFSIVNKLIALNEDTAKQPHACREGIKYFKSYTLQHFAQEEEYMRQIAYQNYNKHKRIHDKMKEKTIPSLEQELEEENYSEKSVQRFMGLCIGWLNAHIIVEDCAIAQKDMNNWVRTTPGDEIFFLGKAVEQAMQKIFQIGAKVFSPNYSGENFYPGNKLCYRLNYRDSQNAFLQVFFIYEDRQIIKELSDILGRPIEKIDRTALYAMKIISEKFMDEVKVHFPLTDGYVLEKTEIITFDQFVRMLKIEAPVYSLLLETQGYGKFALCVRL